MKIYSMIAVMGLVSVFGTSAWAQVNLDKPVMLGLGDQVYESTNEGGWYYFFPKELCRETVPEIKQQGERLFSEFNVGLCDAQVERVKAELIKIGIPDPKVRVFQGINAVVSAMSLKDMYGEYDPKIEVLGDPGKFAESVPYRISLFSGERRKTKRDAEKVMETLFGPESIDAFVQVEFTFSSIFGGQPRESVSAVSVYVGRGPMPEQKPSSGSYWPKRSSYPNEEHSSRDDVPQIQEERDVPCWANPTPGVICVR